MLLFYRPIYSWECETPPEYDEIPEDYYEEKYSYDEHRDRMLLDE